MSDERQIFGLPGQQAGWTCCLGTGPGPTAALNVLMFAVDDLRPLGTAFGEPGALMPNLDLLAAKSTIFTNAYAQASTCGVSRSSLLTSRRPDTTRSFCSGDYNTVCPFTTSSAHKDWVGLQCTHSCKFSLMICCAGVIASILSEPRLFHSWCGEDLAP